jgi:N-acetylneuraminic acid mutarotase
MKKTLYFYPLTLLGLILISANSGIKEGSNSTNLNFQDLAGMNLARGGFAYSSDNDNIYVSNGFSKESQYTTEIEKYSVSNNTWTVFAQSLVAKKYSTSAIVGNYLYIFGGKTDKDASNEKMEVVDLSNGNIKYTTNNPSPADICGAATWDESIYVFGGSESNPFAFESWARYSDKLYRFDTSTSTWTELASMPECKETKGAIVNGKLYVFGGYNGYVSNRIDMYDIKTNVWKRLGKMPKGVSANAIAVYGTTIFIAGDYTNETYLATYEVNSGVFNVIQSNMKARRHAGAAVINSKLYIMGGIHDSYLSSLQMASLKQ